MAPPNQSDVESKGVERRTQVQLVLFEVAPFSKTISKENTAFQATPGCLLQLQAWGSGQLRVGKTIDKTMSYLKMGHGYL